ncbi:O-acetylhomoserine aminocarboxypropyltransferase/cysteine synthase family protein [Microbacterium thalli]|uniref:PLP-dependent transferase n=1 Tax=Microbacterium thalli TaxID=3027921 RepID=A0ABT5SHY0_9MICO|nr:PLP-dependent transferase [Microbacterium thalli]MDD7928885.1 PLP-dependent transferase [Microbacterium thalli]MDD7961473.1 PLP-dependent transferase [Microbacterium thalli]MDN8547723.1 PLP-dependent transferase [Microbacterium thalli]
MLPPRYDWHGFGFDTRQVHAGETAEPGHGARITPVYLTAAYRFDSFAQAEARFTGADDGQLYSRNLNPTHQVAERRIASLEGGSGAIVVGSGQAAITAVLLGLAGAGERIVSTASIYSGTRILFDRTFARLGVASDYVRDARDEAAWDAAIGPATKAIFIETIPNPKNDLVDVVAVSRIARRHGIPLIVDNTVATPYLIRPLELGADVVIHSSTKFLSGHGAALSGAIVDGGRFDWVGSSRAYPGLTEAGTAGKPSYVEAYGERALEAYLRFGIVNDLGAALSPVNSFLLQQGIETLSLRMERHLANAAAVAAWLDAHPAVESVDFAGLPDNPFHDIARDRFGGHAGSVFAFTVRGGRDAAEAFMDALQVFSRMTNIGDVRSMALHPATTTHVSFPADERARLGIGDGLVRLSIGIETVDDLIADLSQGLDAATRRVGA